MDRQPDEARILNAVRAVARQSHEPKRSHWKAAQKILNYLLETAHLTPKFKQDSSVDVGTLVYVDADFVSKATGRRSVLGATVFVAAMLVVWISRTQKCVSQSTSEAEYLAMGDGVKEALFVIGMFQFLRPSRKPGKIDVLDDNEGAIVLAENPLSSCRSKHIDVRHHVWKFDRGGYDRGHACSQRKAACEHPHEDSAERSFGSSPRFCTWLEG